MANTEHNEHQDDFEPVFVVAGIIGLLLIAAAIVMSLN